MSKLDEVISCLEYEDGEIIDDEDDSSFVTAPEDASWRKETTYEGLIDNMIKLLRKAMIDATATAGSSRLNNSVKTDEQCSAAKSYEKSFFKSKTANRNTESGKERSIFQTKAERINKAIKESVTSSMAIFDDFFGIRIRNPKISSATFNAFVEGRQKVRPSELRKHSVPSGDWVTLGVIATKSDIRKSANDNEYMFFMVADLTNCQSHPIKVLMFGDCVKEYWKVQVSTAIALLSPSFCASEKATNVTLRVIKPSQILCLGICPDFAFCKSRRRDGDKCRNFVNTSVSEYCAFHIETYSRHFAARRGAFSSISFAPPKRRNDTAATNVTGPRVLTTQQFQTQMKTENFPLKSASVHDVSKDRKTSSSNHSLPTLKKENVELKEILKTRADSLGAKNLTKHFSKSEKLKDGKQDKCSFQKSKSFKDFFNKENEGDSFVGKPCLGRGFSNGEIVLHSPIKKSLSQPTTANLGTQGALQIFRKKSDRNIDQKGVLQTKSERNMASSMKRCVASPSGLNASTSVGLLKKPKVDDKALKDILKRKSSHEKELLEDDQNRENEYFDNMEKKEKVETFVTSLMEVKDCSVVTCKMKENYSKTVTLQQFQCNYTAQKQSDYCKTNGHKVIHHKANKRFFKCCNCSRRVICYDLLPTKPCPNCGEKDYERVAMREERKVSTPGDKLLIRGEEIKFINR
uniref:Protein MCM10 homolog n=1 Tax=Syphacia muris TaxID=451379 RepID=A0A0N5AZ78_9BILA